jgi:prostaglandin-endoperoxide synthase 2
MKLGLMISEFHRYKKNWISAEFAVLYRWHSIFPNATKWGSTVVSSKDLLFHNDLLFNENACNGSLADVFVNLSNHRATALTISNTEESMIGRDKAAMQQSRACRLRSYCDYVEYSGLKRPNTFGDITKKKDIQQKLAKIYKSVDKVEFWPGLLAGDFNHGNIMSNVLTRLVAKDAFSQAYTHPLLSENVWKHGEDTFGKYGWALVQESHSIKEILARNTGDLNGRFVGMSRV